MLRAIPIAVIAVVIILTCADNLSDEVHAYSHKSALAIAEL